MSLFNELKRRNVLRVGAAYVVGAWLVIQVVETIFPVYGLSDAAIRLVISALSIAFIPSLVFAWAFEVTPEGLKREVDVVRDQSITRATGKRLDRIIMVLLALALGYFSFDKFVLSESREASIAEAARQQARSSALVESFGEKSIAVLPFINMSADSEQEYFSDGISEELLNLLAKIPELRVISRSSAFSFKGKDVLIPAVAEQLNVAHVLEGSVRRAGNRVRIAAQLIEARSDTHLWSESYDRELDDIFAVQDEIASAISHALKVKLALNIAADKAAGPTDIKAANANAYDAYLRGRELIHLRNQDSLEDAIRHLERSLRLDFNFAPAHAQLAIATTLLWSRDSIMSLEDVERKAIRHLKRAQELEPNLAEAHGGRALLAIQASDWESTIKHARKALASNPTYTDAMNWLYISLNRFGGYEEAEATLQRMLVTDPLTIVGRINYTEWLAMSGRDDEAHEMADQLLAQNPEAGYFSHADTSLFFEGDIAEGLSWSLKWGRELGRFSVYSVVALTWVGEYDEARRGAESMTYVVDFYEGRFDEAIQETQRIMSLDPNDAEDIGEAAYFLYVAGRIAEALPLLERALDYVPEGRPLPEPYPLIRTMGLALARRNAGNEVGAQVAAQIVRQDHAARRAAGRQNSLQDRAEAMISAFEYNSDGVIAALKSAIQSGLRDQLAFDDPIFEDLWDKPRFIALQQELDTILAVEHDKVLQLICFNNPVPDDWQPMPETCEGVDNLQD